MVIPYSIDNVINVNKTPVLSIVNKRIVQLGRLMFRDSQTAGCKWSFIAPECLHNKGNLRQAQNIYVETRLHSSSACMSLNSAVLLLWTYGPKSRARWGVRRVSVNRWSFKETFKIWFLIQLCLLSIFESKFPFELIILNSNWRQSLLTFLGGWIPLSDIFQMVFDLLVFGNIEFLGGFLSFPLGRFYTKDIFKDQLLLSLLFLKLNNYYNIPTLLLFPTLQIALLF